MGDLRIESSVGAVPGQPTSQAPQAVDILAAASKDDPDAAYAAAIDKLLDKVDDMDITSGKLAAQLQELTKFTDIVNELKNILSNLERDEKPTEVFLRLLADLKKGIIDSSLPVKVKEGISKNIEKISAVIIKEIDEIKRQYPDRDPLKVISSLPLGQLPAIDDSQKILPTIDKGRQIIEVVLPSSVKPDDYIKAFNEFVRNSKGKLIDWTGATISINGNKVTINYSGVGKYTGYGMIISQDPSVVCAPFGGNSNDRTSDSSIRMDGYNGPGLITQIINQNNAKQESVSVNNTPLNTLLSNLNIASTAVSDVSAQTQVTAKQALTNTQMTFTFASNVIDKLFKLLEKIQQKLSR